MNAPLLLDIPNPPKAIPPHLMGDPIADPYSQAGVISRLFYYWAYQIIKLASLTPLKNDYLGKLKGEYECSHYLKNLQDIWEGKGYKHKRKYPLILTGFRANMKRFILVIILSVIRSGISVLLIATFRQYMKMFTPGQEDSFFLGHLGVGIFYLIIRLLEIFFLRKTYELQALLGYKSGIEFTIFIFDKILKCSPASMKPKAKVGEIINFIQVDGMKLNFLMTSTPDLLTIPLTLIVYCYMLFEYFGVSFLFGMGTLILFLIVNFFLQKRFKDYQKIQMRLKDKRMKVSTETFNNLKVLKLYAWEDEFLNRINLAREDELDNLDQRFDLTNINQTLGWLAPVATSVASIGAYQAFSSQFKIEDIFTCLGIFTSIQGPIRMLPMIMNNFYETTISMKRIEKYLFEDDVDETKLTKNDEETIKRNVAIKVENGYFTWGASIKEDSFDLKEPQFKRRNKMTPNKKPSMPVKGKSKGAKEAVPKGPIELSVNPIVDDKTKLVIHPSPSSTDSTQSSLLSDRLQSKSEEPAKAILKNINLEVMKGEFVCIIGEVGSGKSSLLQAILNNMISTNPSTKIILNGGVSYVSQTPWIQNATVRNNIIFYQDFDQKRYDQVIELCELKPDLEVLVGGDMTEIGEKGINLSGGQKARISIARALYPDKDIYMLDDPISALDSHVGMNVMQNCILDYLKGKTRILITHALQYVSFADRIIYMKDGELVWQGNYEEIKQQAFFMEFYFKMKTATEKNDKGKITINKEEENGEDSKEEKSTEVRAVKRITRDEDKEEGRVNKEVYKLFFKYAGGFWIIFGLVCLMILMQAFKGASDMWLGYWTGIQNEEDNNYYFGIYSALGFSSCIFNYFRFRVTSKSSIKISRTLHLNMINSLIRAPISTFHETIPKGQIFNRLSKDIFQIDIFSLRMFADFLTNFTGFVAAIVVCSIYQPYCLIFLPILTFLGYKLAMFYVNASRELSRIEGIVRSPVLNLVNEALPGTTTIRAYNYEKKYMEMLYERNNEHLKIRIILNGVTLWFDLMLDFISFLFIAFLIGFTMIFKSWFTPQVIGILLTYSISLQSSLIQGLHMTTMFENGMVGLERCLKYTTCPSEEPKEKPKDLELKNWPSEGRIEFIDYSVKYRPDTEVVLKNLNFSTLGREKVGIVGRTGSGKSTISLCLFRLLEPLTGKIIIDDVDISTIGLSKLRSSLTIIPQDPSLMEGTLKYNIDPLALHKDEEIMRVLEMIEFDYIAKQDPLGLNLIIAEGGSNLSVGEKQLICIARAILRKSKIVVMDEATANIDYKTEEIIQKAIEELMHNSTVITIAHRIKTIINCSRVLVLDYGEIVDFDNPKKMLENKDCLFAQLYHKSTL